MNSPTFRRALAPFAFAAFAVLAPMPLFAGAPLICVPYEIGQAASLPFGDRYTDINPDYDRGNLVRDTLALLAPDTPVLVRMETIRRSVIYATLGDRAPAFTLLEKLRERARDTTGPAHALALFDLGFFSETLRQAGIDRAQDGYALLVKAAELRGGGDAELEFALALSSQWPRRAAHADHLARARALAKPGSLLATNLVSHFGKP